MAHNDSRVGAKPGTPITVDEILEELGRQCPACRYDLTGLCDWWCPECGLNLGAALDRQRDEAQWRSVNDRKTRRLRWTLAYFLVRGVIYYLDVSSTARHLSLFVTESAWECFLRYELETPKDKITLAWRCFSTGLAVAVLLLMLGAALVRQTRATDRWQAGVARFATRLLALEVLLMAWWNCEWVLK